MRCVKGAVYVGPTAVAYWAGQFEKAGITVTCQGTQHIHIEVPGRSFQDAEDTLYKALCLQRGYKFASDYRMRPLGIN